VKKYFSRYICPVEVDGKNFLELKVIRDGDIDLPSSMAFRRKFGSFKEFVRTLKDNLLKESVEAEQVRIYFQPDCIEVTEPAIQLFGEGILVHRFIPLRTLREKPDFLSPIELEDLIIN